MSDTATLELKDIDEGIIDLDTERGALLDFTKEKWLTGSYLWKKENYIIISFISLDSITDVDKKDCGTGLYRKLCQDIQEAGMGIIVPTPSGRMAEICAKQGYSQTTQDGTFMLIKDPPGEGNNI